MDIEQDGVRYEGGVGFGLPMHEHPAHDETHTIECVQGFVAVFTDNWCRVLGPGDAQPTMDTFQRHAVAAISKDAIWFHRWPSGLPRSMRGLDESQKHLVLNSVCELPRRFSAGIPLC